MNWNTKIPLIAILRGIMPHEVNEHIHILIAAGFEAIEIPLNSPDWQKSIGYAVNTFGDKALIGAGTVLNVDQIDILAKQGCQLIVTPNVNTEVIKKATAHNMVICAGCATVTEAFNAIDAGAQTLKIFPAASFGTDYIRAIKTVLPKHIALFAVGGITSKNLHQYLQAGCIGAGLGNDLYRAGQSPEITEKQALAFIHAYQQFQP